MKTTQIRMHVHSASAQPPHLVRGSQAAPSCVFACSDPRHRPDDFFLRPGSPRLAVRKLQPRWSRNSVSGKPGTVQG